MSQTATGTSITLTDNTTTFSDNFSFPLVLSLENKPEGLSGTIKHGYVRNFQPGGFGGFSTQVETNQSSIGQLQISSQSRASGGFGKTEQNFKYLDSRGSTYNRDVSIDNVTTIVRDNQSGTLAGSNILLLPTNHSKYPVKTKRFVSRDVISDVTDLAGGIDLNGQPVRWPSFIQSHFQP